MLQIMASKKLKELNIDDCLSSEGVDSELSLVDEEELPSRSAVVSGQLQFDVDTEKSINDVKDVVKPRYTEQVSVKSEDSRGVLFEISSARIVRDGRNKYVAYSLAITNNLYRLSPSVIIEKRYSDFERLNASLQKKFSHLMKDVSFPKKMISGNFKDETIALRSRAFEQFLSHIYAIDDIAESEELKTFFFQSDLSHAYALLFTGQYQECLTIMEHLVQVQEKLLTPDHPEVLSTLCAITAAFNEMEQYRKAEKYSRYALQAIGDRYDSQFLAPLLQLTIRLCWKLEKNKHGLEAWLLELEEKGVNVTNVPKLLEVVVRR